MLDTKGTVDYEDYLLYVGQLIKKLETDIYRLTKKTWPFFFWSIITYLFLLYNYSVYWIIYPKYQDHSVIMQFIGNLIDGFSTKKESLSTDSLKSQLLKTQIILILLIIQSLIIQHYTILPEQVNLMEKQHKKDMIKAMQKKMLFYTTKDDNSIDVIKRSQIEGEFIESYKYRNATYGEGPLINSQYMLQSLEEIQAP